MKSQNVKTITQNAPNIICRPDVPEEKGQNGPTLAEIRERAFEIHTERGGIHGCDLDDWLPGGTRAPGKVQEQRKRNKKELRCAVKRFFRKLGKGVQP
jgi:hypothetical protein